MNRTRLLVSGASNPVSRSSFSPSGAAPHFRPARGDSKGGFASAPATPGLKMSG
jgi:hypothetical protein